MVLYYFKMISANLEVLEILNVPPNKFVSATTLKNKVYHFLHYKLVNVITKAHKKRYEFSGKTRLI